MTPERSVGGSERYEILDEIGRGGMGVVYRAYDRRRREEVAVKALPVTEPEAVYRFKQEFRALAGVVHPNLVPLYELAEISGVWSIAMELVRGVDFLTHVRPASGPLHRPSTTLPALSSGGTTTMAAAPAESGAAGALRVPGAPADPLGAEGEARLRAALGQLAGAVHALHSAGKLHCDIKPHNVLVTPEGRVIVLDFGLVTELVPDALDRSLRRGIAGTAAYMAPEQLRPGLLTPAADWYAFGVLLYEALTGHLPFAGDPAAVLSAKQRRDPVPPRAIAPDAPEDLCGLCVELLRRSPAERPEAPEIFAWLGLDEGAGAGRLPSLHRPFVGRSREIEALGEMFEAARRGRAVTAFVHGPSGIGKSTLVRRVLERLAIRTQIVILEGRCHEHESVPYRALDGVIDRLSQYLLRLGAEEAAALLPEDAHLLGQAFPVLKRSPAIARRPAGPAPAPDPQETRRRVFASLRELLRRIAVEEPLVLVIDDIQWADADSAALLLDLFSAPSPPPLLLIASFPAGAPEASPALAALLRGWASPAPGHDVHRLELGDLGAEEAHDLAQSLLGSAAADAPDLAGAIVAEAGGSPLLAQELATHALMTGCARVLSSPAVLLDDVLRDRLLLLRAEERRLLEIVSIAGHPVPEAAADRAAGTAPSGYWLCARLRALRLVALRGADPARLLEPYHDRIRHVVTAGLGPEVERAHHLALARALEDQEGIDPEIVAEHYDAGGAPEQAARHHVAAAERAAAALAFSRAASLYRAALGSGARVGEAWRLRARLAEALASDGQGREAAASFAAAAREVEEVAGGEIDALDLRRRAAEHYLRSGHVDEGLALLREVLARTGASYPGTPTGALMALVRQRARLRLRGLGFRLRGPEEITARDRIKVEAYWSAGLGLSMVDSMRAAYFQTCHELLALDLGEPVHVARGLCSHVATLGSEGGAANRRRCEEVLAEAEALARRIDEPSILMLAHFCAGTAAYFGGRWRTAVERYRAAQRIGRERCVGVTWELNSAVMLELWALAYLGDLPELSRRLPRLQKEARERDDVFAETGLLVGLPSMVWLARDLPRVAEEDAEAAMRRWTSAGFHSQHYFALVARAQTALYRGDGVAALRRIEAAWPALTSAKLLRLQSIRIELHHLRARAALAAAGAAGPASDRQKLLRLAARDASRIAGEDMSWAAPLAALIEAGVLAQRGEPREAARSLGRAARALEALDMELYAACARFQRRRLAPGVEDGGAEAWMERQGVVRPAAMAAMLVPVLRRA